MARLHFSASAKDDLDSIAEYIADESGNRIVGKRFTGALRRKCHDLAAAPIRMGDRVMNCGPVCAAMRTGTM